MHTTTHHKLHKSPSHTTPNHTHTYHHTTTTKMFKRISKSFKSAITKAAIKLHIKKAKKAPIPPPLPPRPQRTAAKICRAVMVLQPDETFAYYFIEENTVIDCAVDTSMGVDQPIEEQVDIEMQEIKAMEPTQTEIPMAVKKPLKSILKKTEQVFPSMFDSQDTLCGDFELPKDDASQKKSLSNYSDFDSKETLCDDDEDDFVVFSLHDCDGTFSLEAKAKEEEEAKDDDFEIVFEADWAPIRASGCDDVEENDYEEDLTNGKRLTKSCSFEAIHPLITDSSLRRAMSHDMLLA